MNEKKTALIIEDDQFLLELYEKIFTQRGYEVYDAADGLAGLEKASNTGVDIIILDIMLPKMDGISVLKKLKEDGSPIKETPVYMLTNLGQESVIKEALRLGAEGYIIKSTYLPNQIVDEIDKYFAEHPKKSG